MFDESRCLSGDKHAGKYLCQHFEEPVYVPVSGDQSITKFRKNNPKTDYVTNYIKV